MSERYLQSLAILLAGLFSAERLRSNGLSSPPLALGAGQPTNAPAKPAKATEN